MIYLKTNQESISALGHELVSQVESDEKTVSSGIDAAGKNFIIGNSKEITCIATWAVSGSTAGAIGANVLSKACTGTGVVAAAFTSGGGLAVAATCGAIDITELDTLAGMLTGGAIAALAGIRQCTKTERHAMEQGINLSTDISILESKKDDPLYKRGLNNSVAARQKRQAAEDRRAAARDRIRAKEESKQRDASKKIDELIGTQEERVYAAAARERNKPKPKPKSEK